MRRVATKGTKGLLLLVPSVAKKILLTVSLIGLGWFSYSTVRYLRTAPHFEVRQLSVSGLKHVKENQVLAKAGFEPGTNVFAANLGEIRERVEQLPWVRHALVHRVMPDQIIIKVIEREPIGIARIRGDVYQFDVEGMILDPDPDSVSSFPILNGLRRNDPEGSVKKIETYRKILEELGQSELSEVHINEVGEVSVVSASDPLLVTLGTSDFRTRWISYLQLKPQIQQQYSSAVRVDLRFRNQVIVKLRGGPNDEDIVWDAERKAL